MLRPMSPLQPPPMRYCGVSCLNRISLVAPLTRRLRWQRLETTATNDVVQHNSRDGRTRNSRNVPLSDCVNKRTTEWVNNRPSNTAISCNTEHQFPAATASAATANSAVTITAAAAVTTAAAAAAAAAAISSLLLPANRSQAQPHKKRPSTVLATADREQQQQQHRPLWATDGQPGARRTSC